MHFAEIDKVHCTKPIREHIPRRAVKASLLLPPITTLPKFRQLVPFDLDAAYLTT